MPSRDSGDYTTTTHHKTNTTNSYNYNSKTQRRIEGISWGEGTRSSDLPGRCGEAQPNLADHRRFLKNRWCITRWRWAVVLKWMGSRATSIGDTLRISTFNGGQGEHVLPNWTLYTSYHRTLTDYLHLPHQPKENERNAFWKLTPTKQTSVSYRSATTTHPLHRNASSTTAITSNSSSKAAIKELAASASFWTNAHSRLGLTAASSNSTTTSTVSPELVVFFWNTKSAGFGALSSSSTHIIQRPQPATKNILTLKQNWRK